jgi:orotate phosphoribosyltransferase
MAIVAAVRQEAASSARQRLIDLVSDVSLLRGKRVKLASGAESTFYFNMKPATFDPEGSSLIADMVLAEAQQDEAELVCGLEMGAVPIVACVAQLSGIRGRPIQGFFVRKVAKEHGTKKTIEGLPERMSIRGQRVLVVDDVTTTGSSALKAVEAARAAGAEVRTVVTIVDRQEGAAENLARHGLRLIPLTSSEDYGIHH